MYVYSKPKAKCHVQDSHKQAETCMHALAIE